MNYIKEMNAFYCQIELNPLSSSAVALWHALMHINNKAGWRAQFTVAVAVLRTKSGLKESSFQRAREELVEKGYIRFTSRAGNQAAIYQISSLVSMMEYGNAGMVNEKKETQTSTTTEAGAFFQKNIGTLSPYLAEELNNWAAASSEELVLEAMRRAVDRNKASWGYVKNILQIWAKTGIHTLAQAQEESETYKHQNKQKRTNFSQPKSKEVIPDWFAELRRQQEIEETNKVIKYTQTPEKDEEYKRMLAEFSVTI